MTAAPDPLTPADCDLRDFPFMALDVSKVLDSDTFALSTGDEFKAAFALWAKAWHQVPAGSVPDDDRILARLVGVSVGEWRGLRDRALSGFVKCADGRLYHRVVCEKAVSAWAQKQAQRAKTEAARVARAAKRGSDPKSGETLSQSAGASVTEETVVCDRPDSGSKGRGRGILEDDDVKGGPAAFDRKRWLDRLIAVAGPGLADPAKQPSLHLTAAEFDAWANAGVDLELDAVPVVQSLTAKARASPIGGWSWFRAPVLKAHASRTADLSSDVANAADSAKAENHARSERPASRNAQSAAALDAVLKARKAREGRESPG